MHLMQYHVLTPQAYKAAHPGYSQLHGTSCSTSAYPAIPCFGNVLIKLSVVSLLKWLQVRYLVPVLT